MTDERMKLADRIDAWEPGKGVLVFIAHERRMISAALRAPEATNILTADEAWHELVEKDDRNSPEDYPEMCLITIEELRDFMQRASAPEAADAGAVAWCQPMDCGKHTPRKFMIYFDDPDHGIMVFDNEAEARAAFERKNTAWNCYLFGSLPLATPTAAGIAAPHNTPSNEGAGS